MVPHSGHGGDAEHGNSFWGVFILDPIRAKRGQTGQWWEPEAASGMEIDIDEPFLVTRALCTHVTCLIPTATLGSGYYYSPGKDKETEAPRGQTTLAKVTELVSSLVGDIPKPLLGAPLHTAVSPLLTRSQGAALWENRTDRRGQTGGSWRGPRATALATPPAASFLGPVPPACRLLR